jgi:hypothetical protein
VYVYTWNAVQKMTYAFWNKYVTEAWALVDQEWVNNSTGLDPEKVNLYTLGQEFAALTGQPNPFPNPVPVPPNPPTPPNPPVPPAPPVKPTWWDEFIAWVNSLFK